MLLLRLSWKIECKEIGVFYDRCASFAENIERIRECSQDRIYGAIEEVLDPFPWNTNSSGHQAGNLAGLDVTRGLFKGVRERSVVVLVFAAITKRIYAASFTVRAIGLFVP